MMRELAWRFIAWAIVRQRVFDWLMYRGMFRPYSHITSADGRSVYMFRWWIFNPYVKDAEQHVTPPRWPWLPSIRVHQIMRPDQDRDLHDHPWNARTIVFKGWYNEIREADEYAKSMGASGTFHTREQGYTGRLLFGQYHRITEVSPGGVYTLFFTWRKRGTWGFKVNGRKVPWREYLGVK